MQIKSHKEHSISNSKTGKDEIWQYQVLVKIWTNLLSCYYIIAFLKLFYVINPQRAFLDIFFLILTPSILIAQIYSTYVNVLWPYGRPLTIVISTFFSIPPPKNQFSPPWGQYHPCCDKTISENNLALDIPLTDNSICRYKY